MINTLAHIYMEHEHTMVPVLGPGLAAILVIVALWSVFWKGLALWHAARNKAPVWFVIMLIVNTAGILEIIYLFAVAKLKFGELFKNKK